MWQIFILGTLQLFCHRDNGYVSFYFSNSIFFNENIIIFNLQSFLTDHFEELSVQERHPVIMKIYIIRDFHVNTFSNTYVKTIFEYNITVLIFLQHTFILLFQGLTYVDREHVNPDVPFLLCTTNDFMLGDDRTDLTFYNTSPELNIVSEPENKIFRIRKQNMPDLNLWIPGTTECKDSGLGKIMYTFFNFLLRLNLKMKYITTGLQKQTRINKEI